MPPYVQAYDELKSKGVSDVYCIASNDVFVSESPALAHTALETLR